MFCPSCGNETPQSANFCSKCGCKINENSSSKQQESVSTNKKGKGNGCSVGCLTVIIFILFFYFLGSDEKTNLQSETSSTPKSNSVNTQQKIDKFKKYLVYSYLKYSIYVFQIPQEEFNKNEFVDYVEKNIPRSKQGDANFVFVFDKPLVTYFTKYMDKLADYSLDIPLYINDVLWKQHPYFYYNDGFGTIKQYCTIDGLNQEFYEKNQSLQYNETEFTNKYSIKTSSADGLNVVTGCNKDYKGSAEELRQMIQLDQTLIGIMKEINTAYNY